MGGKKKRSPHAHIIFYVPSKASVPILKKHASFRVTTFTECNPMDGFVRTCISPSYVEASPNIGLCPGVVSNHWLVSCWVVGKITCFLIPWRKKILNSLACFLFCIFKAVMCVVVANRSFLCFLHNYAARDYISEAHLCEKMLWNSRLSHQNLQFLQIFLPRLKIAEVYPWRSHNYPTISHSYPLYIIMFPPYANILVYF